MHGFLFFILFSLRSHISYKALVFHHRRYFNSNLKVMMRSLVSIVTEDMAKLWSIAWHIHTFTKFFNDLLVGSHSWLIGLVAQLLWIWNSTLHYYLLRHCKRLFLVDRSKMWKLSLAAVQTEWKHTWYYLPSCSTSNKNKAHWNCLAHRFVDPYLLCNRLALWNFITLAVLPCHSQ